MTMLRRMRIRHDRLPSGVIVVAAMIALVWATVALAGDEIPAVQIPALDYAVHGDCGKRSTIGYSKVGGDYVPRTKVGYFQASAEVRLYQSCTLNAPTGPDDGSLRIGYRYLNFAWQERRPGDRMFRDFLFYGMIIPQQSDASPDSLGYRGADRTTHLKRDGEYSVGVLRARWKPSVKCKKGSKIRAALYTFWQSGGAATNGQAWRSQRIYRGPVHDCPFK